MEWDKKAGPPKNQTTLLMQRDYEQAPPPRCCSPAAAIVDKQGRHAERQTLCISPPSTHLHIASGAARRNSSSHYIHMTTTLRSVRRRLLLLGAAAAIAMTPASAAVTSADICTSAEFQALTATTLASSPVTIKSLIKGDMVCLEFALTTSAAWFAVGLATSDSMVSSPEKSVMLFQSSVASPESYVLGGYTRSDVSKASDQTAFALGAASASAMTFSYQRTLAAASTTEVAIAASAQSTFIWAYGSSWPISSHRSGTMGSATYTFGSADGAAGNSAGGGAAASSSSTTTLSAPFCKDKNCAAIVGGTTFGLMLLAGLLVTKALERSPVGRVVLHRTLAAPPVKATTNAKVANPLTTAQQTVADLKVGEALVVLLFAAAVVVLLALLSDETTTVRSGSVALLVLLFILLPVTRLPLWSLAFGSSFERIVKFHRWLGFALTITTVVHLVLALKLTNVTQTEPYGSVTPVYGFIAFVAFAVMTLLSVDAVRRVAFEVFYITHRVLAVVGLVFAVLHAPKVIGLALIVPLTLYVLATLVQLVIAYTTTFDANVSVHDASGATSLVLQPSAATSKLVKRLQPGAFFWLQLPAISQTQWHPFSAIVTPDGESIGFCIKAVGDSTPTFTQMLLAQAQLQHSLRVRLSGPVGKLTVDVDAYDAVVMVAGGIGITPMLSLVNQKRLTPLSPTTNTKAPDWLVVWSTHEASHLLTVDDFLPTQTQLEHATTTHTSIQDPNQPLPATGSVNALPKRPLHAHWHLHVSRATTDGAVTRTNGETLAYRAGRPVLDEFVNATRFPNRRVAVLACGPPTLVAEAQMLARECGFDFHKEVFHW